MCWVYKRFTRSNICLLGALSLGWNRSFEEHRWVEIDNGGSIEPMSVAAMTIGVALIIYEGIGRLCCCFGRY